MQLLLLVKNGKNILKRAERPQSIGKYLETTTYLKGHEFLPVEPEETQFTSIHGSKKR